VLKHRQTIAETESCFLEDAETAVISYGFTARTALYAVKQLRKEGLKVGFLRLKTIWPFPEEAVREATTALQRVLVPEMNRGQVAGEVRKCASCELISLNQTNGEVIPPEYILGRLRSISR
jgi:2-oxoglutarate ferredoxin oxidoreductase subunit alpha